jgi:hypothetical protein
VFGEQIDIQPFVADMRLFEIQWLRFSISAGLTVPPALLTI